METSQATALIHVAHTRRDLGDGLALEPLTTDHATRFAELIEANRDFLGQWMTWVWDPFPPQTAAQEIQRMTANEQPPWSLPYAITEDGSMIGFAHLFAVRFFLGSAEVSYWIDSGRAGRGITTRAVRRLSHIAFADLHLHRLELRCAVENVASAGVARACGFTHEGTLRDAFRVRDELQTMQVHSLLATDGQ